MADEKAITVAQEDYGLAITELENRIVTIQDEDDYRNVLMTVHVLGMLGLISIEDSEEYEKRAVWAFELAEKEKCYI